MKIGTGFIDHVAPEVWAYEVSGKQVLRQWFSYRRKNRERPMIGDTPAIEAGRNPARPLPARIYHVLTLLTELEPAQAAMPDRVCDGPLVPASKIV